MRKKINKHQLMHLVYLIIKYFFNHFTKIVRTPYSECREDMNSFNVVHFFVTDKLRNSQATSTKQR